MLPWQYSPNTAPPPTYSNAGLLASAVIKNVSRSNSYLYGTDWSKLQQRWCIVQSVNNQSDPGTRRRQLLLVDDDDKRLSLAKVAYVSHFTGICHRHGSHRKPSCLTCHGASAENEGLSLRNTDQSCCPIPLLLARRCQKDTCVARRSSRSKSSP